MFAQVSKPARGSRLDPFIFHSDTDARFILLVVAVLGMSLALFSLIYNAEPARLNAIVAEDERCMEEADLLYPNDLVQAGRHASDCAAPVYRARSLWQVAGVVLLSVAAGVIYWAHPYWIRRRQRLETLTVEDAPELTAYVAALCREAGLDRQPMLLIDPTDRTLNGQAFGRSGQYFIWLSAGLITKFVTDRPAFRAVVLHEIAHLQNRDVDKTYLAIATGFAFVAVALIPYLAYRLLLALEPYPLNVSFLHLVWRLVAITALVYVLRNAVLRARELYADARVSPSEDASDALQRVLEDASQPRPVRIWERWRAVVSHHPDNTERRRVLDDPGILFRVGVGEAFAAGLIMGLALMIVDSFVTVFLPAEHGEQAAVAAALVFIPLAAWVVVPNIWRATYAAQVRGRAPQNIGLAGAGLGLGYLLGLHVSPGGFALFVQNPRALSGIEAVICDLVLGTLLLVSLAVLFHGLVQGVVPWLDRANDGQVPVPRRAFWGGLAVGSVLLTVWLHRFTYGIYSVRWDGRPEARVYSENLLDELTQSVAATVLDPITLAALGMMLAFILAGYIQRWRLRDGALAPIQPQ